MMSLLKYSVSLLMFVWLSAAASNAHSGSILQTPKSSAKSSKQAAGQQQTESPTQAHEQEPDADVQDDSANEDLEPAAVQLDVSHASPLIRQLYQATRETKEQNILASLGQAKKLLEDGADLKATDADGRTALHWAVFGASYSTKSTVLVAYEEIADTLINKGADINKEDVYQNTALDYLLNSPSFEMQTLLIEHGASSGFLSAFYHFFDDYSEGVPATHTAAVSMSRKADLTPGATMSVRLDVPVYSDRSRTGDPISATVTYPLCKNGEQVACNDGELLVPPGTKVNGTILFAAKAPNKYSRPRLVLDFSNVVHKNGDRSPLYTRVLDVDNARETIRNNEILGIIQPHASTKASIAMAALGASNPIAGYTIKGVQTVYGLSIRREIYFPAGTDIQIQVVRPSMLKQKEPWPGWQRLPVDEHLRQLVESAPMRTATPGGKPSDPTNLMFLGSRQQLIAAFGEAGWFESDNVGVKSALKAAQATMRQTGYAAGPMSTLLLENRPPDLTFQKSLDTFAKRHHLRVWRLAKTYDGQQLWVGAATHDIGTERGRAGTKWTHRIDPHIDRERDWVETDLLFVGTGVAYADIERPHAPKKLSNATGDEIVTDGKMCVVQLWKRKSDTEQPVSGSASQR